MTYIVSGGALDSTHSLTRGVTGNGDKPDVPRPIPQIVHSDEHDVSNDVTE